MGRTEPAGSSDVFDPVKLSEQIGEHYRSYLEATFYFRDPELRAAFRKALGESKLTQGPFLEATPAFLRTVTPRQLISELLGTDGPDPGFVKALSGDRRLYWHQEQAIRLAHGARNVIVATGTGSGKTEAFLYPILLDLYREHLAGTLGPGVRALILYPMNALAYDQLERLETIARTLQGSGSSFRFTFGQYIGDTPDDEKDQKRQAAEKIARKKDLPAELVTRAQMREQPPHILVTNYSMLEYLLVRPEDSPLFSKSQDTWTFLVIDEVHQYRGVKGSEIAMLLRRLKKRLRRSVRGRPKPFRCMATSATLANGEDDRAAVAQFATALFGEPFDPSDVVMGRTIPIESRARGKLPPDAYAVLTRSLSTDSLSAGGRVTPELARYAAEVGVKTEPGEEAREVLPAVLLADKRAEFLRWLVTSSPGKEAVAVADGVFHDLKEEERTEALARLTRLLMSVKNPDTEAPLLSARYHFFVRSLEGAFVRLHPTKSVYLSRPGAGERPVAFEVALCRQCGQHYLVGREERGYLREAKRDPGDPEACATFYRPLEPGEGLDQQDEDGGKVRRRWYLCVECGALWPLKRGGGAPCGHEHSIVVEEQPESKEAFDQIPVCTACGYRAPDPVREVTQGADGPNVVLATTICESLPQDRRKILAFTDSRQDAAFFAWYLEDSYRALRTRKLILRALRLLGDYGRDGASLRDLADSLYHVYRETRMYPKSRTVRELKRRAWADVYGEFLTEASRISLEGVGLVHWFNAWVDEVAPPECLTSAPWNMSLDEAGTLVRILLDMARAERTVEIRSDPGILLAWADLGLEGNQKRLRPGKPSGQKDIASWDGRGTRRVSYLTRVLMHRTGVDEATARDVAEETLRQLWDWLEGHSARVESQDAVLLRVGDAYQFNPEWWRLRLVRSEDVLFRCSTCGRIHGDTLSSARVCSRRDCSGELAPWQLGRAEPSHYRSLYTSSDALRLRCEEHTAQLSPDKARDFQHDFKNGKIELLSSSTTFELGVDLGDLDVVFLRNVPPEAFNYAQRVGRAGRRSGYPGVAVTYCRRSPHDVHYFFNPQGMLAGTARPPDLKLANPKVALRHLAAEVLAHFFEDNRQRFASVGAFCGDFQQPTIIQALEAHISRHRGEMEKLLLDIFPAELHDALGLKDGTWPSRVAGPESPLAEAVYEVSEDYRRVEELEKRAVPERQYNLAQWAKARAQTIADEEVVGFLSRHAVIPKYGFPVDVVELDLQGTANSEAASVRLQRDLSIAIAEFAPGSKVVANKKEWGAVALKRVPDREFERYRYRECPTHGYFAAWPAPPSDRSEDRSAVTQPPELGCNCKDAIEGQFIIPRFGFVGDGRHPKEPKRKPVRLFTTRPRFLGLKEDAGDTFETRGPIRVHRACPGRMVVLCEGYRGQGFYICPACGAGFSHRSDGTGGHTKADGSVCRRQPELLSLGHRFETDVVRLYLTPKEDLLPGTPSQRTWFAYSVAYALLEGSADQLQVPSTDIGVALDHNAAEPLPGIVLYDDVPGGAGLVASLERPDVLRATLEAALKRVSGDCGCGEDTSCYGCLRSYRNQFAHPHMQRGPAKHYLEWALSRLTPP